jgi:acetyl esterase/lipase
MLGAASKIHGLAVTIMLCTFTILLTRAQQPTAQPGPPPPFEEMYKMPLVYSVPGEDQAQVQRDIVYKSVEGSAGKLDLKLDVYTPHGPKPADRFPAVVLISGGGADDPKHDFRDAGVYLSYGRVLAASGFVAITFNKRYQRGADGTSHGLEDFNDMVRYVRDHAAEFHMDPNRMAFWAFSGGGMLLAPSLSGDQPFARADLCFYCVLDVELAVLSAADREKMRAHLSPLAQIEQDTGPKPAILIARAGLDSPDLNRNIERFVDEALTKNLTIEVMNHPQGRHAFDTLDPGARSSEIIQRALDFLHAHLRSN